MRVLYISGPYRAPSLRGVINNIRRAEAIAIILWEMGYAVICPHLNTQLFPGGAGENETQDKEFPDYLGGDCEIIKRLIPQYDGIVMISGWSYSEGSRAEFQEAQNRDLFVYFWPIDNGLLKRRVNLG